jgi:hypothetical protein
MQVMCCRGIFAVLFAFAVLALSCSVQGRKPPGLLGKEDMVRAMTELYLAEQRVATIGVKRDSVMRIFDEMSPGVLARAGTTDSVFRKSFAYYMDHPQQLEEIYTALIDSLNLREQKMISNEVKK